MNSFVNWFNGKKTVIAGMYWGLAIPLLPMIYNGNVPDDVSKWVNIVGLVLTYLGLGHKAFKTGSSLTNNKGKAKLKTIAISAAFSAGVLAGIAIPQPDFLDSPTVDILLEEKPYTKISSLFGHGTIKQDETLTVLMVPSWSDSTAQVTINGADGLLFSVKVDTVWSTK